LGFILDPADVDTLISLLSIGLAALSIAAFQEVGPEAIVRVARLHKTDRAGKRRKCAWTTLSSTWKISAKKGKVNDNKQHV